MIWCWETQKHTTVKKLFFIIQYNIVSRVSSTGKSVMRRNTGNKPSDKSDNARAMDRETQVGRASHFGLQFCCSMIYKSPQVCYTKNTKDHKIPGAEYFFCVRENREAGERPARERRRKGTISGSNATCEPGWDADVWAGDILSNLAETVQRTD